MDGGADRPAGVHSKAVARGSPPGAAPLVGRQDALDAFGEALDASGGGSCCFLGLAGDPGAGKTRLLSELAADAAQRGLVILSGRAAEFEQEMPFGVVADALDDHVEAARPGWPSGWARTRALCSRWSAVAAGQGAGPGPASHAGLRPRPDRPVPDLPAGCGGCWRTWPPRMACVLNLDDVHWADTASVELLDHLVRHPPRGRVLVAIAYRRRRRRRGSWRCSRRPRPPAAR